MTEAERHNFIKQQTRTANSEDVLLSFPVDQEQSC